MPRPSLNSSKTGLVGESRKASNKSLKFKKSISTASGKCNSKSPDRLVGGADAPIETEDATEEVTQETLHEATQETVQETVHETVHETTTSTEQNGQITFPSGPCCSCLGQEPGSTGDKKVDEMIDYVHQNLQEAGKALATLSENFEHETKLMFVDILGKIQQWTSLVQNKLDLCKADIEALRKELMARACEIANLRKLLAECREREAAQKQVTHTVAQEEVTHTPEAQKTETVHEPVHEPKEVEKVVEKEEVKEKVEEKEVEEKADTKIEIVCTDAAIQSIMKDKDRMRREMELEAEIDRLRKENERIIKERAEYENAIQRALLRGVSSLNVEALRVLRCPPIPCCSPCAPCPATAMKPSVCKKDSRSTSKGHGMQRSCNRKNGAQEVCSHTIKRPCDSPCCFSKNRKSVSNNSMILLLHRDDTENICSTKSTVPPVCGSPMMKKIEIPPCPRFI
ncbi:uncharacterized protein LOC100879553 isoform X1 [Megachile rotundata]|uniref:uncharacterized protein LOC100879553 isoform X1 n=1 Tax=Megachile rotundata TaxID=143995 RepID=UPI003FD52C55